MCHSNTQETTNSLNVRCVQQVLLVSQLAVFWIEIAKSLGSLCCVLD